MKSAISGLGFFMSIFSVSKHLYMKILLEFSICLNNWKALSKFLSSNFKKKKKLLFAERAILTHFGEPVLIFMKLALP